MRTPTTSPEPICITKVPPKTPVPSNALSPTDSSSAAVGKHLTTEILELFFLGGFSFWRWVPARNSLTTHGSLSADTLEDWMMRIHPRDQGEFSRFIDQPWQKGEPSVSIEYRFNPSRQGEWLRVRHTASWSGSGDQSALSCLIEVLPLSVNEESPLDGMAEVFRVGEAALSQGHLTTDDLIDDTGEPICLSLFSAFTDSLIRGTQRSHGRQGPLGSYRRSRQPSSRLSDKSNSSTPAGESAGIVAPSPPATRPGRPPLKDARLEGTTILLVEDEDAVRKLVRKLLEMLGCNVIEAVSGREALDLWPSIRDQVALLISDIVMPDGVSGWELAKELHQNDPALGILLTSGYDEFSEDHALQDLPQIAFLQKPYEVQRLKTTLSELMEVKLEIGKADQ